MPQGAGCSHRLFSATQPLNTAETIIRVLLESGTAGISARRVALHVHGEANSLFAPVSLEDTKAEVAAFLKSQSRRDGSGIERVPGTHRYRVNPAAIGDGCPSLQFLRFDAAEEEAAGGTGESSERELSLF